MDAERQAPEVGSETFCLRYVIFGGEALEFRQLIHGLSVVAVTQDHG